MLFSVSSELDYEVVAETTMILNIEAQHSARQQVRRESFSVTPRVASEAHEVPETGNRYRRLKLAPGRYTIRYTGEVETEPAFERPQGLDQVPVAELPFEVLPHLSPSRYCQVDRLSRFAWREFGGITPGLAKVTAICDWIHANVDYLAGSSDGSTSAADTFAMRAGVCRDFAHLGITLTRAVGIPARFVSAYALELEPQDFHAVFEAYLGREWYLFDATKLSPKDGLVRIAVGRDAADSAFSTFYGQVNGTPARVGVERLDAPAPQTVRGAVSLAAI